MKNLFWSLIAFSIIGCSQLQKPTENMIPLTSLSGSKNSFDMADNKIVALAKFQSRYKLIKSDSISFFAKDNDTINTTLQMFAIDKKHSKIYAYLRSTKEFACFDKNDFSKNSFPLYRITKNEGQGPNDIILPIDMVYDEQREKIYVADLVAFKIYIYDTNFNEIDRIKLQIKPFRLSLGDDYLYISSYNRVGNSCRTKINLNTKNIETDINPSEIDDNLARSMRNRLMFAAIDDSSFFAVRQYPTFNIYKISNNNINSIFCDPVLNKLKLPIPQEKMIDGDMRSWAIKPYINICYNKADKLLFTLTTLGWPKLAKQYNLKQYIIIYNDKGESLCRYQLPEQDADERSQIIYDSSSKSLYYLSERYTMKFNIEETSN